MTLFKFFHGRVFKDQLPYDGVTTEFMIEIYENIHLYSERNLECHLIRDEVHECDSLVIVFEDIDHCEYFCTIYDDRTFSIFQIIGDIDDGGEVVDTTGLDFEITSDYNNLLNFLRSELVTIRNYFYMDNRHRQIQIEIRY